MRYFLFGSFAVIVALFAISGGCGNAGQLVNTVAFSSDGEWLAAGMINWRDARVPGKFYAADVCRTVELIKVEKPSDRIVVARSTRLGNGGPLSRVTPIIAFRPATTQLTLRLRRDRAVSVFDPHSGNHQEASPPFQPESWDFAYSPDGSLLASGTDEGLKVFDIATGKSIFSIPELHDIYFRRLAIQFSPDSRLLVIGGWTPAETGFWDARTGARRNHLPNSWHVVGQIEFSPDGARLAAATDSAVRIATVASLLNPEEPLKELLLPESNMASGLAFSPDGESLAVALDDGLSIYSVHDGSLRLTRTWNACVTAVAWTKGTIATGDSDGKVILWDETLTRRARFGIRGVARINTMIPIALLIAWIVALRHWMKKDAERAV